MFLDTFVKNEVYFMLIESFLGEIALNAFALKGIFHLQIVIDIVITKEIAKDPIQFR